MNVRLSPLSAEVQALNFVDLATGTPDPACLGAVGMARFSLCEHELKEAFGYAPQAGDKRSREFLVRHYGHHLSEAKNLILTHGALGAIDLLSSYLSSESPTLFVVDPTYREALKIFAFWNLSLQRLQWSEDGSLDLTPLIEHCEAGGKAALYLIPSLNNPDGRSLSVHTCSAIAVLCLKYDIVCMEDDAYGKLFFDPLRKVASVFSEVQGCGQPHRIARIVSFSKIVMPGLRVAFIETDQGFAEALAERKRDFGFSPVLSALACKILEPDVVKETCLWLKGYLEPNMLALVEACLAEGFCTNRTSGGYFLWVHLGRDIDTRRLLPFAVDTGISFSPGEPFSITGARGYVRLSYSHADPLLFRSGVSRLKKALQHSLGDL